MILETLQERIIRHEGFCEFPKVDVAPEYCIGYGHDITEHDAQTIYRNGIPRQSALELLEADIANAKDAAAKALPWILQLSEIRQEVLQEMCFQMGITKLLRFHKMLIAAQNGDDAGVIQNMLDSDWHSETPDRCEELASLWEENDDG